MVWEGNGGRSPAVPYPDQDYSPLEIIVSDDHSTDGTWDVIQRELEGYSGQHRVKIRRNPENLGIAGHINQVWRACEGEWIFASAGDDRSHPSRVSRAMHAIAGRPDVMLVQSLLNEIDAASKLLAVNRLGCDLADGEVRAYGLRDRMGGATYGPHGAGMAYARQLVDFFGMLPGEVIFEDNVMSFRAELLGSALVMGDAVVDHRNHPGQITRSIGTVDEDLARARLRARLRSDVASTIQNVKDLERARERVDPDLHEALRKWAERRARYFEHKRDALLRHWPRRLVDLACILPVGSRVAPLRRDDVVRSALPGWFYSRLRKLRASVVAGTCA